MAGGFTAELEVRGRRVVVVGGGVPALAAVAALLRAQAEVTVFSVAPTDAIRDLADRGRLTLRSVARAEDLDRAALVVFTEPAPALQAQAELRGMLTVRSPEPIGRPVAQDGPGTVAPVGAGTRAPAETGTVTLVGGGPGDPGLITVAGLAAVAAADVLVADRLAPLEVLSQARVGAEIIDVSKIPGGSTTPQEDINRILVEQAREGRNVVRLKGGDVFVFGRGGEEWQACAAAGIAVRVIPGVSSATAGPALAGIPVTHRTLNQGFTVVTAHVPPGDPRSTLDWEALSHSGTTLILLMGVRTLPSVTAALIGFGTAPDVPAASVADAGLPSQRKVVGTVATIADLSRAAGFGSPAITIIGEVAAFDPMVG